MANVKLAGDAPPIYFLVTGIVFGALGLYLLFDWRRRAAKEAAEPRPPEHLSPAQQRLRAKFAVKPGQYKTSVIAFLLMGAFFIGLYIVTSRA